MVTPKRLNNIFDLAEKCEKKKIPGAFVECGVWKGGSAAIMAYVARKYQSSREIWLFDSFEGMPEPTKRDGLTARQYAAGKNSGKLESINECVASIDDVEDIFKQLSINRENVHIQKGWFQNTLPKVNTKIGSIALLRLDGDWYDSVKVCLDNLYNLVVPGGYVIIDDYWHWDGCRKAVNDFFKQKRKPRFHTVDMNLIYFKKEINVY